MLPEEALGGKAMPARAAADSEEPAGPKAPPARTR